MFESTRPNLFPQISGTPFQRKEPEAEATEAMRKPIRIPTTNIHCQSISGISF